MKVLSTSFCATFSLSVGLSVGLSAISAPAAASTSSVDQVVDWFTGFFDNAAQVQLDPSIPFLTMENCSVSALGSSATTQYVHLEQYFGDSGALLRNRAYAFSPSATGVDLSVFSYQDGATALGTCDEITPSLDLSNLLSPSCDVLLVRQEETFAGNNAPDGCPTSFPVPGSTVVSTVTISANAVDSLDTFFLPSGGAFGTPIEFRRVSTAEPGLMVGFLALGATLVRGTQRRQR